MSSKWKALLGKRSGSRIGVGQSEANSDTRSEITQICDVFRGKIIDVSRSSFVIEATGNENKIKAFLELLKSFGVRELARTGTVSLRRGSHEIKFSQFKT